VKAQAVELRYFLGCTVDEAAMLLSVSPSSIDRDIRFSLAWLHERLHPAQ
jgi:DNA-directed RNA polymerase specialized sigma24 family protein